MLKATDFTYELSTLAGKFYLDTLFDQNNFFEAEDFVFKLFLVKRSVQMQKN